MTTSRIIPQARPRLQRPQRGGSQLPALIVQPPARPVTVPTVDQARARRKLLTIYTVVGLFLFAGWLAKPPAQAEAETPPATMTVGEHTFTEVEPEESALVTAPGEQRQAKISHYWPPLGGVNCAVFRNGQCVSNMASGLPWDVWVGRAAACPVELPFWSTVTLPGGETFVCLDRGGKVVTTAAGELWIDLLVESAPVPYGTTMPVTVRLPWDGEQ